MRAPRAKALRALEDSLKRLGQQKTARRIFEDCPNLERISARFAGYVTPLAANEQGTPLLDSGIGAAIAAYRVAEDPRKGIAAYIGALEDTSEALAGLRFSVRDADGHWVIWRYDEPLSMLMEMHGREVVQTRTRAKPEPVGPIAIKLLAAICTTADLQVAGIDRTRSPR